MADFVFNSSKGKAGYLSGLPEATDGLVLVALKDTVELDDVLKDYDNLAALLANNDEADFTNYARIVVTSVTETIDDTLNRTDWDFANQSWDNAGGATDNDVKDVLVCYDPDTTGGSDSDILLLTCHDFEFTTTGADLPIQVHPSGFYGAR